MRRGEETIGHATEHLSGALALGGGAALFLAGQIYFRWRLKIGANRFRIIAAIAALATVPVGLWLAIAQVATLVLVFGVLLAAEDKPRA
ncbi:low temperature requirement A protein (LtrA) [Lentzea atacamensis]|uniref:Low temperature requirement A protein (LtrA) n=1 Tax=Lentzea atacamensis TaxID=531938 RepID=A0ABX9E833_9PSEU|nr:hypothetical protein [Lentzea atacamensis]RAS64639.1 low temperature requirement A protein (LtrA) [Lentzea atacamensis]